MKYKFGTKYLIGLSIILSLSSLSFKQASSIPLSGGEYPTIEFIGAAQSIGGSAILVNTGVTRFLIDYGLYFANPEKNNVIIQSPETLNFVLLTHAHIDHSGRIPMLYKKGFDGPTVAVDATEDLTGRMLDMSLGLGELSDSNLFDRHDLNKTMRSFQSVEYGDLISLAPDVEVQFNEAGHIMGSAIIEIWIKKDNRKIKLVAGGDMGGREVPVIRDKAQITDADYVIVESTYGDTDKGVPNYSIFENDVRKTLDDGGSVFNPAFVLEKTQKLITLLCDMKRTKIIPDEVPIYVDSSTAHDVTLIYYSYSKYYDDDARDLLSKGQVPYFCKQLEMTSGKVALASHSSGIPAIYISSSGMLEHVKSPKHLAAMIEDKKNLLAIVGWQAPNTPGWNLQNGAKFIDIPVSFWKEGKAETEIITKPVVMKVKKYGQFSSHADGCDIMNWLAGFNSIG